MNVVAVLVTSAAAWSPRDTHVALQPQPQRARPVALVVTSSDELSLDAAATIDRATATTATRSVVRRFRPDQGWLWRQWEGTATQLTWRPVLASASLSLGIVAAARLCSDEPWPWLEVPPSTGKLRPSSMPARSGTPC